jgi:hypothetical protein
MGYCALLTVLLILAAINPLALVFGGLFAVTFVLGIGLGPIYFGYVVVDAIIRKAARLLLARPQPQEMLTTQ